MKVLVLTSGGDAPGMNMVIGTLYKKFKGKLYACRAGFKGLVNNDIVLMKEYKPLAVINQSGSVIKCSRCSAFKEEENFKNAVDNIKRFSAVIVIGGNGSLRGAQQLSNAGVKTIFIPATIDNDIEGSDYSIGFHTAIKGAVETFRNIMPSLDAHQRVGVFEVMGRNCDKIANAVATICKPDFVITKLNDINYNEIAKVLINNEELGEASSIIIKENIMPMQEFIQTIRENINQINVNSSLQLRAVQVGYIQRGFKPTKRELNIAKAFAKEAIKAVNKEKSIKLISENGKIKQKDL